MLTVVASAVSNFVTYYSNQVIQELESIPERTILSVSRTINAMLRTGRGTLYVFGNGGSYAVSRQFEVLLRSQLRQTNFRLRVNCGINPNFAPMHIGADYESIFTDVLESERADSPDLVIFVSGSGDSDNLLRAAVAANNRGIQTISFSGFGGGKIAQETDLPVVVTINDQQSAEDTIQPLMHIVALQTAALVKSKAFARATYHRHISDALGHFDGSFILRLGEALSDAFLNERGVYVLAPEGQGMSISAEHTAHNFNWDAVYQLPKPPKRYIFSTPTYCDYSGVGNDRLIPGIVTIQQLDKARANDVLLLFVHDPQAACVRNTLRKARRQKMQIFLVSGLSCKKHGVRALPLHSQTDYATADLLQMFGHITARVLRLCLKKALISDLSGNAETLLISEDMAQRRFLTLAGITPGGESYED